MTMSQQPSQLAICWQQPISEIVCNSSNKNNTHTHWKAHIYFQSQIIKKSWLKKFERVQSSTFICTSSRMSILTSYLTNKQCEMWQEQFFNQSPEEHHQNSIYLFHISQKMSFLFSLYAEVISDIIIFFCNPRIRVEPLMHCWCCCHFFLGIDTYSSVI